MISKRQCCEWNGIHRQVIKVKAHQTTMLAVVWLLPSIIAAVVVHERPLSSLVVWIVQVALITAAIYFWRTEEKRKVTVLEKHLPRRWSHWIDRTMNKQL